MHVPFDRNEEFLEKVYDYLIDTPEKIREDPQRGENALTEKIVQAHDKFRMFADIDFKIEAFRKT